MVGMSRMRYFKAHGTKSFIDLASHPGSVFGGSAGDPSADLDRLRQGVPIVVAAFWRRQGTFRQGRLVLCADGKPPITWERYRFLRGYSAEKPLPTPYELGHAGPVAGRGAWNVDGGTFAAVGFTAGGEEEEFAVPAVDVQFLRAAVDWLTPGSP
jgi:hypothetical protein